MDSPQPPLAASGHRQCVGPVPLDLVAKHSCNRADADRLWTVRRRAEAQRDLRAFVTSREDDGYFASGQFVREIEDGRACDVDVEQSDVEQWKAVKQVHGGLDCQCRPDDPRASRRQCLLKIECDHAVVLHYR
jgi:hypothetical protein